MSSSILISSSISKIYGHLIKFNFKNKVDIRIRDERIRGDFVSMNKIIEDDLLNSNADIYIQTHSTNPLLNVNSIDKALTTYLKTKLNLKNSEFKNEIINIKLQEMNLDKESIGLLFEIFENCQLARYTPLNIDAMSDDYRKANQFIEQFEKH